jgi:phage repressor protein C with HTH and peptisase S24 domain
LGDEEIASMRKIFLIRRIVGSSMLPTLKENHVVLAIGIFNNLSENDLVLFEHEGMDKIKRIHKIDDNKLFVVGDNTEVSKDSRVFGWIPISLVKGRVIWPRA